MLACDRSLIDTRALPTPGWCRSLAVAEHWSPRKCSQYWQSSGRGGPKMCVWQNGACVSIDCDNRPAPPPVRDEEEVEDESDGSI